uniref:Candidate secreted effector n=1 Tax=Meloidogyne incognita TaxID=6306 RepID=A0A914N564_MELIC
MRCLEPMAFWRLISIFSVSVNPRYYNFIFRSQSTFVLTMETELHYLHASPCSCLNFKY